MHPLPSVYNESMRKLLVCGAVVAAFLLTPSSAGAQFLGTSFGGRVIASIPCVSPLGPSLHVTIAPSGIFSPVYIWTPATLTYTYGPPTRPGQQVLGLADVPFGCMVGTLPLYGQRMTMVGTSLLF